MHEDLTNQVPDGPLGILVACAASNDVSAVPSSFPAMFQSAGYRCVVAPFVTIKVEPSCRLVESIYRGIGRRLNVAEALVEARRELLRSANCPIGLLFIASGDSHLYRTD